MWLTPGHEFSALVHILLIWAVRALSSEVSGIPSEVLALEGQWEDRSGETPNSSEFLAVSQMSPLLSCWGRESVSLLSKQNMQFSLEPLKWPLSFSELTFCGFYRTAVCEM